MSVFTISFNDPAFDKKSSEVAYIAKTLDLVKNELVRAGGAVTSGTILGVNHLGVANTSLGSWTYTPSASKP